MDTEQYKLSTSKQNLKAEDMNIASSMKQNQ